MAHNIIDVNPLNIVRHLKHLLMLRYSISMSQAGQDFWVYGEVFDEMRNGFFLDIGAHNGVHLSNSYILEKRYGWRGICVEANPQTFLELEKNRQCYCINTCVDKDQGYVDFIVNGVNGGILADDCDNKVSKNRITTRVETMQLLTLLEKFNVPETIDYLSLDVEGAEDRVLLGFNFDRYIFNCITVERPSKDLRALLESKKYIQVKEIPGLDCFYIHSSFLKQYQKNLFSFGRKNFLSKRLN